MKQYRVLFLFCCIILFPLLAKSQVLQGVIINEKGEAIPNSSIYISEIARGIVANDNGQFQTSLKSGTYTCEFRSLGYESKIEKIDVPATGKKLQITLTEKIYGLEEVVVVADDENPGNRIMRKVIAYAPFYRNQVNGFRSNTYTKGNFRIDKIPGLIKKMSKVNGQKIDLDALIGKTFVMESDNEITFKAPNEYKQQVKAVKSSIPKEFDMGEEALKVVNSNIYDENLFKTGAFKYYIFKWEEVETNAGRTVHKIKVTPRYKNADLYSGYLYIIDGTWNVYSADLSSSEMGATMRYRVAFHEVKPSVYMPTSYDMRVDVNTMGVKGGGRYFVSIAYHSVDVKNEKYSSENISTSALAENNKISASIPKNAKRAAEKEKAIKQIEKLSEKEKLSTREAYKMSKLMQTVNESDEERENRKSLEIKDFEKIEIKIDTLAYKVDSAYWKKVRVIPLEVEESRSYVVADSLYPPDSLHLKGKGANSVSLEFSPGSKSVFGKILMGGGYKLNEKSWINFDGLAFAMNDYNFVDGFSLGQSFRYHLKLDSNRYLSIKPDLRYVTAREKLRWKTDITWHYEPIRQGYFNLSFGHTAEDINSLYGLNRFLNMITTATYGGNYIRFYDRKYLYVVNRIDVANGLNLATSFTLENRQMLQNLTSYNFFDKSVKENMPEEWAAIFPEHRAAIVGLKLTYTPFRRYRIRNGRKTYASSVYPTFSAIYKKGLDISGSENKASSKFDLIEVSATQTIRTSLFSRFKYSVGAGKFLDNKSMFLPDYRFFRQNPMLVTDKPFGTSFSMLPDYTYSRDYWVEFHSEYTSDYLLLKRLPFLQQKIFDEALHFHYLNTDGNMNHFEGGYSVGLGDVGRVGLFTSFEGKEFNGVSLRISIPIFTIFGE